MKSSSSTMISPIFFLLLCFAYASASGAYLRVGYYQKTCPEAETIVRKAVKKAVASNPGIAAGLIRMHFHDCFVRGCDASVLLESHTGKQSRTDSPVNTRVTSFEVIEKLKHRLRLSVLEPMSCADIIAFAAHMGKTQ
ncbi:hypothetical protein SLA2020_245810 [Shorea laevis]